MDEYVQFQDCMKNENRRWAWMPTEQKKETNKYDYMMKRLEERRKNMKFAFDNELQVETPSAQPSQSLKEKIEKEKLELN